MTLYPADEIVKRFNFDGEDIAFMSRVERFTSKSFENFLASLNEHCLSKDSEAWSKFHCEQTLKNLESDIDKRRYGSARAQICNCCGDVVYMGEGPATHKDN